MATPTWTLSASERRTLERVLDALLPPTGSFPLPSQTGLIDDFVMQRVPASDERQALYPGLDAPRLKSLLGHLSGAEDMTDALSRFEREQPELFQAIWRLAVYGYYSRPETIAAIQHDLTAAYHGAPLPRGYAGAMPRWDANDPLQMPRSPRGTFIPTNDVKRVNVDLLTGERSDQ
jgi:hypothetical protein